MASTVRNIGELNVIAVRSARGIIGTAANRQNMAAVPAVERNACERKLRVLSKCSPPVLHAISARTTTEMTPRTKIVCPAGMALPRNLMHTVIAANTTTDANFKAMPRTGRERARTVLFRTGLFTSAGARATLRGGQGRNYVSAGRRKEWNEPGSR